MPDSNLPDHAALPPPTAFWRVVRLLLAAAARRGHGRRLRGRQRNAALAEAAARARRRGSAGAGIGLLLITLLMAGLHAMSAFGTVMAISAGARLTQEQAGLVLVSPATFAAIRQGQEGGALALALHREAQAAIRFRASGSVPGYEAMLRRVLATRGAGAFVVRPMPWRPLRDGALRAPIPRALGSLMLLWWSIMLIFQGEGLEVDSQRRRHPMWEWLLSHPVPPGAVFLAEMLSPIAANPLCLAAPVYPAVLFGIVYGPWGAVAGALLAGVPITIAASCLGKSLEIAVMLRFPPRSRGAIAGLMGWLGYASFFLMPASVVPLEHLATSFAGPIARIAQLPWPAIGLFLGARPAGGFSLPLAIAASLTVAAATIAAAVGFATWSVRQGLAGAGASQAAASRSPALFNRHPQLRKEMLWFVRDRAALVQVVLIPLTFAGVQLFNLRPLLAAAASAWNTLCGTAILFGTYFLIVLGPRSLASDGPALWLALTWPQGLEAMLRAKAWLWTAIATCVAGLVFLYAGILYPPAWPQILLAFAGWGIFARAMAQKAVTLASIAGENGEPQRVPWGRRWAAQLGMLTFAIGVLSRQWDAAFIGIVYAWATAAATWQNFRARLPFLFDPWSEVPPAPPTLMHALIAISVLVEGATITTAAAITFAGRDATAIAHAASYAVAAVLASAGAASFLGSRGVSLADTWLWAGRGTPMPWRRVAAWLLAGGGLGLGLGLCALVYLAIVARVPGGAALLAQYRAQVRSVPHGGQALLVIGVLIAPLAEEYLFRGLLYRALAREWGGLRAVAGSAVFFAVYHPALSWLPVAALGAANAMLFRRSGQLAPCVVAHAVYNAVVLVG